MAKKSLVVIGGSVAIVIALFVAYQIYAPDTVEKDAVEATFKSVLALQSSTGKQFPRSAIKEYKNITEDVIRAGLMPKNMVKNGKGENVWSGKIVVQVFPDNGVKAGIPATINYVFEAIPEKDCARLVEKLGRQSNVKIFRINLEPSKKAHTTFPISGDSGCLQGINNIGYTVLAN